MKIAFTADVHLHTEHPERYSALEDILGQLEAEGIEYLVVAGDLFDKQDPRFYPDFKRMCRKHSSVRLLIIPGNHDPNISDSDFGEENVWVCHEPTPWPIGDATFLLIPYEHKVSMGDKMAGEAAELAGQEWMLVGHGDYLSGVREPNPHEPGVYMPLTRADVDRHGPSQVVLGHIHKATPPEERVVYIGSPHGLDISETGKRRYLLYDTESKRFEEKAVRTDYLYFQESFFIFPADDEVVRLQSKIHARMESWGLSEGEWDKVRLRVSAGGYARSPSEIHETLREGFAGLSYYNEESGPVADELFPANDSQREKLAKRALEKLKELDFPLGGKEPDAEDVRLIILQTIYGT